MDISSTDDKKFDISRIKKTIVIQIDDNGNGSETTIIDPEVNLILAAIIEYCKKNEVTENIKINTSSAVLDQNDQNDQNVNINEKVINAFDIKRNGLIYSKESIKDEIKKDKSIDKNNVNTSIINTNESIEKVQVPQHKHRFLSQDTNVSQNYSYKISNQQYYVERRSYKNQIDSKEIRQKEIKQIQIQKEEVNVSDSLEESIVSNSQNDGTKKIERPLSNTNAPLRKIKKSNFIQRFYDLNK